MGLNVEHITFQRTNFAIWDLGGRWASLWCLYAKDAVGVVYAVDSSDGNSRYKTAGALWSLLDTEELRDAVLLVFANKQYQLDALSVTEVRDMLGPGIRGGRLRWHIQESSAVSGDGIVEGMAWMTTQLKGRTWRQALGM